MWRTRRLIEGLIARSVRLTAPFAPLQRGADHDRNARITATSALNSRHAALASGSFGRCRGRQARLARRSSRLARGGATPTPPSPQGGGRRKVTTSCVWYQCAAKRLRCATIKDHGCGSAPIAEMTRIASRPSISGRSIASSACWESDGASARRGGVSAGRNPPALLRHTSAGRRLRRYRR